MQGRTNFETILMDEIKHFYGDMPPEQLALFLNINRRHIKAIVDDVKEKGIDILDPDSEELIRLLINLQLTIANK